MTNVNELLDCASDELAKREWLSAQSYVDRAMKLDPDSIVAQYLVAQVLARQGKPEQAVVVLEKLSTDKSPSLAVELTLADVYQYSLKEPEKALEHLKKALQIKDDFDIENRIAKLGKQE